ncbi:terminase small subunit [Acutalibacter sp.]|uniref:terminase small subunit n=1 Tax=Acutalibacter sp. TaxID=1918636 RepID=UPI00216D6C97|nr:hypothetical protein [Acutalibacter sp.]
MTKKTDRSLKPVDEMATELAAHKTRDGCTQKIYKAAADEHKGEQLQADLENRIAALHEAEKQDKIDFNDLEQVKRRAYDYLEACKQAAVFPSVMGLAVHGFGISRQALNQYLQRNPYSPSSEFINKIRDMMADILSNAALYRNADAVSVIFQLKNHFDHSDKVQVEPVQNNPLGPMPDPEELRRRIEANCIED